LCGGKWLKRKGGVGGVEDSRDSEAVKVPDHVLQQALPFVQTQGTYLFSQVSFSYGLNVSQHYETWEIETIAFIR
jgi:hypothetical protein